MGRFKELKELKEELQQQIHNLEKQIWILNNPPVHDILDTVYINGEIEGTVVDMMVDYDELKFMEWGWIRDYYVIYKHTDGQKRINKKWYHESHLHKTKKKS